MSRADMSRVTLSAAMRARDVSRPRAAEADDDTPAPERSADQRRSKPRRDADTGHRRSGGSHAGSP